MTLRRVCVYLGSSFGTDPLYRETAAAFGRLLVREGLGLVYGGGSVGLMGVIADAVREGGGEVIGVIPEALVRMELAHLKLDDLRIVASMHERKAMMADLADAFVALPGGIGTLEELFETWTWSQLGYHGKPCGLLNAGGYYDGLLAFLDHAVDHGFLSPTHRGLLLADDDPHRLLLRLAAYAAPRVAKVVGDRDL